tara:strand:+ start:6100 stop:6783 length:684 start_codon:yes stop_codon:yes gene_type:complete
MIYMYHHLGLGDHIICNGMVRYFYKEHGSVKLFCYKRNLSNVSYMYRDLPNLELISVVSDSQADNILSKLDPSIKRVKVGFNRLPEFMDPLTFDEAFYKIANFDFKVRFEYFYLERELDKEKDVMDRINPTGEKYIFIHDDKSRGFAIDESRITSGYKKIYNDNSIPLFHCIGLIENAEEVHVMQSSIKDLINSFKLGKPRFFLHEYVRNYNHLLDSKGNNKFINLK